MKSLYIFRRPLIGRSSLATTTGRNGGPPAAAPVVVFGGVHERPRLSLHTPPHCCQRRRPAFPPFVYRWPSALTYLFPNRSIRRRVTPVCVRALNDAQHRILRLLRRACIAIRGVWSCSFDTKRETALNIAISSSIVMMLFNWQ